MIFFSIKKKNKTVINGCCKSVYLLRWARLTATRNKNAISEISTLWFVQFSDSHKIRLSATESQCMLSPSLDDSSGTLLACLGMQSKQTRTNSTVILLKPSHYFLLWNGAGFLRMLSACNPLGGNHNGKQAAGQFNLHSGTLSGTTPGTQAWKAHSSGRKFRS